MRQEFRQKAAAVLLIAASLAMSGCLSAQEQDVVSYDPATDEFRALMVLTDIRAADTSDLDYFLRLYKNRDHLIAPSLIPVPIIDPMFLRISDSECALVSMFDQPTHDLHGILTNIPLASIDIMPGSLFEQDGKLCYFQAVKVPGKTLDAAIDQVFSVAMDFMKDRVSRGLQKELDRRAAGGPVKTWPEVTRKLIRGIDQTLAGRKEHPTGGMTPAARAGFSAARFRGIDLGVLQTASIQRLKTAIDNRQLKVSRQGPTLLIALPLEADDAKAIEETTQKVNAHIADLLAHAGTVEGEDRKLLETLAASAKSVAFQADKGGLTLRMNLVEMSRVQGTVHRQSIFETLQRHGPSAQPDAQHKAGTPDPVAYARAHQVPVNETLTSEKIIEEFNAHRLSNVASAPGAGPVEGFSITVSRTLRDMFW